MATPNFSQYAGQYGGGVLGGTGTKTTSPINLGAIGSISNITNPTGWKPTTPTPPVSATPAPAPAPKPTTPQPAYNGTPLTPTEMGQWKVKLKTENPTLYDKLYGSTPAEVNVTDIGTEPVDIGSSPKPDATGNPADKVADETINQRQQEQQQEQEQPQLSQRDMVQQWMSEMFQEGQSYDPVKVKKDLGYYDAKKLADDLATDLEAYALQTRQEMYRMNQNPEGMLAGALQAEMQNYEWDRYNKKDGLADIAIAARYAQGRYDSVAEIAKDALDREDKMYERKMNYAKDLYTMLGDDMTDKEEAQFTSTLRMQEQATKDFMDTKRTMMERALNNNAPAEVITAIRSATSTESAIASAGKYGIDPNLTLAQDKFKWDRYYQQQMIDIAKTEKEAKITAAEAEEAQNIAAVITDSEKNIAKIDAILGNTELGIPGNLVGLRSSVGAWQSARVQGFMTGLSEAPPGWNLISGTYSASQTQRKKEDFLAAATSLLNTSALQAFSTLSFSLAPVSNKEFTAVASSASNLAAKAKWSSSNEDDPNAKIVGFTGSEEDLINDFTIMRDNFTKGLENAYNNEAWVKANLGEATWNQIVEMGKQYGVAPK